MLTSAAYRVCVLDPQGRILFSRTVRCRDDLGALAEGERDCTGHSVEVWNARLVARVKADNAPLTPEDRTSL